MKENKSPGQDGLPVEFYKYFWDDIKNVFKEYLKRITVLFAEKCYNLYYS